MSAAMKRLTTTSIIVHSPCLPTSDHDRSTRDRPERRCSGFALAKVEQFRSFAVAPHAGAQFISRPMVHDEVGTSENDAILFAGLGFAHQFACDVVAGAQRIALHGIAPTAAAGGAENDPVTGPHPDVIFFGPKRLAGPFFANKPFFRAAARAAAENTPGLRYMAIIVDRDVAFL